MAVLNTYVSPSYNSAGIVVNPPGSLPAFRGGSGEGVFRVYETWNIAATDSSASLYRIIKAMDPNWIPISIWIANTAMAGSTAFDLGLYKTGSAAGFGAIVGTGNQFVAAGTLATARTTLDPGVALSGLSALPQFTRYQRLFEIAGETELAPTIATTRVDAFDLVLKLTTSGGVAGQVEVLCEFVRG